MADIIEIQDFSQPELDMFARLTENQLRNRLDPQKGVFIAESGKVISKALDAGYEPVALLMERRHIHTQARDILPRCGDVPVYTADEGVLEKLTGYALSRGILCAFRRPASRSAEQVCRGAHRIAVLEGLVDSTNIGAVFRSAAAMHMDGILLTKTCCDPLNRRSVRVSMGTVFQIPWAYLPEDTTAEGLTSLRRLGFSSAAMALTESAISIEEPALYRKDKLAIVLGTEGEGLQEATIAACDHTVIIPMSNGVDSLNVAAAGAVAFWQLRRREQ